MRRLVQAGLILCGASLLLLPVAGSPARAKDTIAPADTIAHAKSPATTKKVAAHRKPAARKPLAGRAHPATKRPAIATSHRTVVAREAAVADRLAAPPAAAPSAGAGASEFVTNFLKTAFRIALSMDDAPDRRRAQLASLMTTQMDLSRILIYATHAAYQRAPAAMQEQVRVAFASFLAEAYTPRIKLAAGIQFTTSAPHRSGGGFVVSTTFTKPGYPPSTLDWEVEPAGASFKIVDVGSEGVSLLEIQRSSFTSVMLNDGGLPGLLDKMDARTRELASAAK